MMPVLLTVAMAILAGVQAPAAAAGDADIVVNGRPAAERRREAAAFVRAVSPVPIDGQVARWHVPFCPVVSGVDAAIARRVAARIRRVARDAGAPVAPDACRGNAVVAFTADARGLLSAMERKRPRLLADLDPGERRALRTRAAPMLWWTSSHSEGADGNQLSATPSVAFGSIGTGGPALPASDRTRYSDGYRSSMISTALRVTVAAAFVLVDVERSTGYRLDAVADHAAFVLLARVRPSVAAGTAPTILRLFDSAAPDQPTGLTATDRAYLSALYATAPDRPAAIQSRAIVTAMLRATDPSPVGDGGVR